MPPPAPGLFSTTTGTPSARLIASAAGRPMMSATPPGGNGTIIVIGRDGYASCATAGSVYAAVATTTARSRVRVRARTLFLRTIDYSGRQARERAPGGRDENLAVSSARAAARWLHPDRHSRFDPVRVHGHRSGSRGSLTPALPRIRTCAGRR